MAYFNDDLTNIRLCALYMLSIAKESLTAPQLTTALIEGAKLQYFEIQLAISELEETGCIASVVHAYGLGYTITEKGKETLALMGKNIPYSLRTSCDEYVKNNRLRIMLSEQMTAFSRKNPSGGYDVILTAFDKDRITLSLTINVATSETAEVMCREWQDKSSQIYSQIYNTLSNQDT